ncbi:MAG: hypothetical protein QM754_05510 [Tepidisphaeraceae bacterium]
MDHRATDRGDSEERQAKKQRPFSAPAVGGGAVHELPERQPDEIRRQRALKIRFGHAQFTRHRREARQVHVDRQRAHRRERAQQQHHAEDRPAFFRADFGVRGDRHADERVFGGAVTIKILSGGFG